MIRAGLTPCGFVRGLPWLLFVLLAGLGTAARADDICARVKIEIRQELTLERQAFDAHMRITNGLSDLGLENVRVVVSFADAQGNPVPASDDPAAAGARFFIRLDGLENIDDVSGAGTVPPAATAEIDWLIIPAPGAANGLASGSMYYVGALLTYTIDGREHTTEVSPDYIFVKPMPTLTLDYFLPDEVFGDDAFTAAVEPPEPFTLGLRVANGGAGTARDLRIDSAQPRIVENEQGLLVDFVIDGSRVNDRPADDSLRVRLGDIAPGSAATARWVMHCSLSGHFIDFTARFSHADELGGELTSLIGAVNTHFLVRDVLVDLPGRDGIRDFLARDGGVYRVYESQNTAAEVPDRSAAASLRYLDREGSRTRYALRAEAAPGLLYVRLTDPYRGGRVIDGALRSDGKRIRPENIWLSRTRDGHGWKYFVNLFDANGTGRYILTFEEPERQPRSPVLRYIGARSVLEAEQLSFVVEAGDPDGAIPALSAAPLPVGARFTDTGEGRGVFDWTPAPGQAGVYVVRFTASDGALSDAQSVAISVRAATDADGDGMEDTWERKYFGNLDRDGRGDFDGDGFSDVEEYRRGSDPGAENNAPTVPLVLGPRKGAHVTALPAQLTILDSSDADGDALTYEFEVFTDETLRTAVAAEDGVTSGGATTTWRVPCSLSDNHRYTWRVRASDGFARSPWAYGGFQVDTVNDPPRSPQAVFPAPDAGVCTARPVLEAQGLSDADEDPLSCTFEVYADSALTDCVRVSPPLVPGPGGGARWRVSPELAEAAWYYWRVKAADGRGGVSRSPAAAFYVDPAGEAPPAPVLSFPARDAVVTGRTLDLAAADAAQPDGDLYAYCFELDVTPTFDSDALRRSGRIAAAGNAAVWTVDALAEDTRYYWRVQARNGTCESHWENGSFYVDRENRAPQATVVKNPGQDAWVSVLQPLLEVAPGVDLDRDGLSYEFEVYGDETLGDLVEHGSSGTPRWRVPSPLSDRTHYFWRSRAVDAHGAAGRWSAQVPLFVDAADDPAPRRIRVRVLDDSGAPLPRVSIRAFTEGGRYTGRRKRTDNNGVARFKTAHFVDGGYRFRAKYCGSRFWSDPLSLPYQYALEMVIARRPVVLAVRSGPDPVAGAKVRGFTGSGRRLSMHTRTGKDGRAVFHLPAGTFRFKVKKFGRRFWSAPFTLRPGEKALVEMDLENPEKQK